MIFAFGLFLVCSFSAHGQATLEKDSTTGKFMYRRVVGIDSLTADQLYERARQWLARAYQSANSVIQYDSKDEKKLIGRGIWTSVAYSINKEKNWHSVIIECKDGRVRYTFTDFIRETYDATLGRQEKPLETIKFMKKSVQSYFADESAKMGADLEKVLKNGNKSDKW